MVVSGKRPPTKRSPAGKRRAERGPVLPEGSIVPDNPEKESFVRGLVERGEAATAGPGGALPPGATHEIVGMTSSGLPVVIRRRFAVS
jgi:hypothetical protein